MAQPVLIYCAAGNPRFAEIATRAGFRYGARLPATPSHPLFFADQDWKNPDRASYMESLAKYQPTMATVLDWEREEQLSEVLSWAEEAAQYVLEDVIIIPKVNGRIASLPREVGGKRVVLGYSVPTNYGATDVPLWEFKGRPVHLLGGSPHRQIEIWSFLTLMSEVVSIDGNYINKMATLHTRFWVPGTASESTDRWFSTLGSPDGLAWPDGAPCEAFRRSCANVIKAWRGLVDPTLEEALREEVRSMESFLGPRASRPQRSYCSKRVILTSQGEVEVA